MSRFGSGMGLLAVAAVLFLWGPGPAWAEEKPGADRLLLTEVPERPASLVPLYVTFASVQALDIHSTFHGLSRGARESNPLMRGMTGSPAAFVAVKAGATAGTIYLAEKIWKRNRKAAIATMIGANLAYGFVVSHNYSVARRNAVQ
jgi:hypothetical protein